MAFVFLEGYMAASSNDPTTGAPIFLDSDAPDPAVNPTEVAAFAAQVGTRLIGSTAQRTAYTYAREGLEWDDTTLDKVFRHDGTGWVRQQVIAQGVVACPGTAGGGSAPVFWSDLIDVTFPTGAFTSVPRVFVQTLGPAGQVQFGGLVEQVSTTGCKVRGIRIAAVPTDQWSVQWMAVQD